MQQNTLFTMVVISFLGATLCLIGAIVGKVQEYRNFEILWVMWAMLTMVTVVLLSKLSSLPE